MKKTSLLVVLLILLLLTACSSSPEPTITDNGNPGQIVLVVYLDENRNRVRDEGEVALSGEQVGISQDISCPAGDSKKVTPAITDANGEALFDNLAPGKYCAGYSGTKGLTTKITVDIYLSSDQKAVVSWGVVPNE